MMMPDALQAVARQLFLEESKPVNQFIIESRRCENCTQWEQSTCNCGKLHMGSGECSTWHEHTQASQVCVYHDKLILS